MIEWLIARGVSAKFAKPLLIAIAVIVAIGVLGVAKCSYDRNLVESHDATRDAVIASGARQGEAVAADERRTDDAVISNQSEEVKNATQSIPDRPTSDRQHARACVILRRQAGASGRPVPAGC